MVKAPSSRATLNFNQFEGVLKDICFSCFLSAVPNDRVGLFFAHINEPCISLYKVAFTTPSKKRNSSNDFTGKTEEINSSLELDFTIKEALETLKTKDESFRSSHSLAREISPIPSIKARVDIKSSDLRTSSSTTSLHRRPYINKSAPDSPNTSILGVRPSSRYHNTHILKDNELDEFLKTEKLVENEVTTVKVSLQSNLTTRTTTNLHRGMSQGKRSLNVKKNEHSRSKPELFREKKVSLVSNSRAMPTISNNRTIPNDTSRKNIVIRLDKDQRNITSPHVFSFMSKKPSIVDISDSKKKISETGTGERVKKIREDDIGKHREYIYKQRKKMFSHSFVVEITFRYWKNIWLQYKWNKHE
ncbi:hypothetical protein SteCoe_16496 [Stentor coeruleus]|uniref:Uncharacterized protein n=1 Tax=Stentor coeruleus TaxID=5963 RepID=A0A1R2C164_9CILI|nr:hypothetical protein SteCoe_16496 [Stentor coeruleus]